MNLSTSLAAAVNRDTVFVSHANPEDNTFALWLTLRFGEIGFKVWCDLTKFDRGRNLLGPGGGRHPEQHRELYEPSWSRLDSFE
jgi:hypothetical protein